MTRYSCLLCISVRLCACGDTDPGASGDAQASTGSSSSTNPPVPTTSGDTLGATDPPDTTSSTSATETSTTSNDPRPPSCGDGIVQDGEACDDGPDNDDTKSCTEDCKVAVCGDKKIHEGLETCDNGFSENHDSKICVADCHVAECGDSKVHEDVEECDLGKDVNSKDPLYGSGCTDECKHGPSCGDGALQIDHEDCEPPNTSACTALCRYQPRVIFITSATYPGNFGGLAEARDHCNDLAEASGLAGSFRPWLLVGGPPQHIKDQFPEYTNTLATVHFTTIGLVPLADSFQELLDTGPRAAISTTEKGVLLLDQTVWTNVSADGGPSGADCLEWMSESDMDLGHVGLNGFSLAGKQGIWLEKRLWTSYGTADLCGQGRRLYCVQVTD